MSCLIGCRHHYGMINPELPASATRADFDEALRICGGLHVVPEDRKNLIAYLNQVDPDEQYDFYLLYVLCCWKPPKA